MGEILLTLFMLITIPFYCLLRGWVASILWGWFIVPVFHLPVLGVMQAWGLAIVVSVFTAHSTSTTSGKSTLTLFGEYTGAAIAPLFVLLVGWIVHSFM